MHRDEHGYIVVETIGVFIPFVLIVISILSLVNIVALQARVHYAITQAANTLSMYSYVLDVTGAVKLGNQSNKNTNEIKDNINEILVGIDSLSDGSNKAYGKAVANRVYDLGENIADDPKALLNLMMECGANEGGKKLFENMVRPLIGRYLGNGKMSGDEYLKSQNVINGLEGLDFYKFDLVNVNGIDSNDSILIDDNGDVKIRVSYEIEYKLPFNPKLMVTQTVKTKAWLNGSGKGYW